MPVSGNNLAASSLSIPAGDRCWRPSRLRPGAVQGGFAFWTVSHVSPTDRNGAGFLTMRATSARCVTLGGDRWGSGNWQLPSPWGGAGGGGTASAGVAHPSPALPSREGSKLHDTSAAHPLCVIPRSDLSSRSRTVSPRASLPDSRSAPSAPLSTRRSPATTRLKQGTRRTPPPPASFRPASAPAHR